MTIHDPNVTAQSVRQALHFLYGRFPVPQTVREALCLLATASFFDIALLCELCESHILAHLSPENIQECCNFFHKFYYGKYGESILRASKAVLLRQAPKNIPLMCGLPFSMTEDVLSSDALCVLTEFDRYLLIKEVITRLEREERRKEALWIATSLVEELFEEVLDGWDHGREGTLPTDRKGETGAGVPAEEERNPAERTSQRLAARKHPRGDADEDEDPRQEQASDRGDSSEGDNDNNEEEDSDFYQECEDPTDQQQSRVTEDLEEVQSSRGSQGEQGSGAASPVPHKSPPRQRANPDGGSPHQRSRRQLPPDHETLSSTSTSPRPPRASSQRQKRAPSSSPFNGSHAASPRRKASPVGEGDGGAGNESATGDPVSLYEQPGGGGDLPLEDLKSRLLQTIHFSCFSVQELFKARVDNFAPPEILTEALWRKEYVRTKIMQIPLEPETDPKLTCEFFRLCRFFPKDACTVSGLNFCEPFTAFGSMWKVSAKVVKDNDKKFVACFLYRQRAETPEGGQLHFCDLQPSRYYEFSISILTSTGVIRKSSSRKFANDGNADNCNWGWNKFLKFSNIDEVTNGNQLIISVKLRPVL